MIRKCELFMATVKGQHLRIFMENGSGDYEAIAASQQCDLSVRLNVKTNSTKDDTDDWNKASVVSLSWEVRTNGLVTIDEGRNDTPSILDRAGETVHVQLALASGEQNSDAGEVIIAGDAIISDISIVANVDDDSTYAVTLTGKRNALFPLSILATNESHPFVSSDGKVFLVQPE